VRIADSPSSALIPESADRPDRDVIFTLHAEAVFRARAGESILNATIGALMEDDGRMAILPAVYQAMRSIDPVRAAGYAPIAGPPAFLDAVIGSLFGEGDLARASVAVATPGGSGAIHNAIVNFLEPGQKLLTSSYYWGPYNILAGHDQRGVATFQMFDEQGGFHLAAFEEALSAMLEEQGRALVVLNFPCHNPTGYSLDEREWQGVEEIVARAAKKGSVVILLDFAYALFAPGDRDWPGRVRALAEHVPVLVAWTASKSFAQYGARVGALVATCFDEDERKRIENALTYTCRGTWSNCNHLGMLAIAEVLRDPDLCARADAERDRLRDLLTSRVDEFNRLAAKAGLDYPRYEGGFFVAVFTPDPELTAERMRKDGVYVVPLQGAVRVALCATPMADLPRLVEALRAGVEAAREKA
jgi:aromatic-amino-acid transaminase